MRNNETQERPGDTTDDYMRLYNMDSLTKNLKIVANEKILQDLVLDQLESEGRILRHSKTYKLENGDWGKVLHNLAQKGKSELLEEWMYICKELLHIWDLDATTSGAVRTPLILAAEKGHFETCKVLVEAGANVLSEDLFGQTAYDYAISNNFEKIAIYLKANEKYVCDHNIPDKCRSVFPSKSDPIKHLKTMHENDVKGPFMQGYSDELGLSL